MHRCLLIDEVLVQIAMLLRQAEPDEQSRRLRDVVAFIRTCRGFREPGLDALWHTLQHINALAFAFHPNITPIFGLDPMDVDMDQDTSEAELFRHEDSLMGLSKVPSPTDWECYKFYTKRIRVINVSEFNVHPLFLTELLLYRPPDMALIPNAQLGVLLVRFCPRDFSLPYITLFVGSIPLTEIVIHLPTNFFARIFWSILSLPPFMLQQLTVEVGCDLSQRTLNAFSQALSSHPDLTYLDICGQDQHLPLSIDDLVFLSRCTKLRKLLAAIGDRPEDKHPITPPPALDNSFASLTQLYLHVLSTDYVPLIIKLTKGLRSQSLDSFTFNCDYQPCSTSQLLSLLEAVATHTRLKYLEVQSALAYYERSRSTEHRPELVLSFEDLASIFSLKDLATLRLDIYYLRLTKEALESMARSLPNIRSLRMTYWGSDPASPIMIETRDLEVFKEHCPSLVDVSIPVCLKAVPQE